MSSTLPLPVPSVVDVTWFTHCICSQLKAGWSRWPHSQARRITRCWLPIKVIQVTGPHTSPLPGAWLRLVLIAEIEVSEIKWIHSGLLETEAWKWYITYTISYPSKQIVWPNPISMEEGHSMSKRGTAKSRGKAHGDHGNLEVWIIVTIYATWHSGWPTITLSKRGFIFLVWCRLQRVGR